MRLVSIVIALVLAWMPLQLTAGDKASDDRIYDLVRRKLASDPDVQGGAFDVQVHDGVVTLKGVVENEKFRAKAERLTKKIKGVTQVDNRLQIGPKGSQLPVR